MLRFYFIYRIAEATPAAKMLERIYTENNRNRGRPCIRTGNEPFRVFWYDVISAADFSDHSLPLLVRRHNVVPGMFLVSFSSSAFNSIGTTCICFNSTCTCTVFLGVRLRSPRLLRSHLQRLRQHSRGFRASTFSLEKGVDVRPNASDGLQVQVTRNVDGTLCSKTGGEMLCCVTRCSPYKGRSGMRSGWGGEIGGVYSLTAVKSRANAAQPELQLPSIEARAHLQFLEGSDASSACSGDTIELINNRLLRFATSFSINIAYL